MTLALAALAAEAGGGVDIGLLAQYGVLGIFAGILVVFAKGAHQRERDRADRLEEETKRLNGVIADRVIPALASATRAAEEAAELLNAMQRERELLRLAAEARERAALRGDNP